LFQCTKRHVELTDAGRVFLDEAREVLARADRAALVARRIGNTEAQRLRVAVGYCMDDSDIAARIGEFNALHDDVQVELRTMSVPAQLTALSEGRLDIGFVRPPITDPTLTNQLLIAEPLVVALPPKHPMARHRQIALRALAHEPFVFVLRDAVPVYHDTVLRMCRQAGFVPRAPHEVDQLQMLLAMVSAGSGVSLVPKGAEKRTQHRVVYRPLQHVDSHVIETVAAWRRQDTSPTIRAFMEVVRRGLVGGGTASAAHSDRCQEPPS
jgi:DNA-binding transcriptional LysR family regulator